MGNLSFTPPPGLIGDDTVFAAPGRWRNGSLVRFWQGSWQVKGGWERLTFENLGGVCRAVLGWTTRSEEQAVAFGLHNGLKVWRGSTVSNITPASFVVGQVDGTGGAGYGTGLYGIDDYGEPSSVDYFPMTWSLGTWGGDLLANPRGQTIFTYDSSGVLPATPLANAPAKVTYMLSTPSRQVMALGCNEEVSGTFNNLCIRWSDIEDNEAWASLPSNNAGEWILESGGRIVGGRLIGDYVLVWTTTSLFLGTFLGAPGQTWRFERIATNCGSISPGAPVVRGQNCMWIAPDKTFWTYTLGGVPVLTPSPIRGMFEEFLAQGQNDKIVGTTISTFGEVEWFYADARDGLECSRGLVVGPEGWSRDILKRSAFVDAGPQVNPIGVHPDGTVYWHEKGRSADGGVLQGFIESTDFYLDEADGAVMINGVWPDFKGQVGTISLTIFGRETPQAAERTYGPWALPEGKARRSFRMAARIARVRFDFASSPCFARGGKPEFDIAGIGGR
jgi:hypothetical protein